MMTKKDKKILEDAERDGIPIFILIAKDELSVNAIASYCSDCEAMGCSAEHVDAIEARIKEFNAWQTLYPDKCKLPD